MKYDKNLNFEESIQAKERTIAALQAILASSDAEEAAIGDLRAEILKLIIRPPADSLLSE